MQVVLIDSTKLEEIFNIKIKSSIINYENEYGNFLTTITDDFGTD